MLRKWIERFFVIPTCQNLILQQTQTLFMCDSPLLKEGRQEFAKCRRNHEGRTGGGKGTGYGIDVFFLCREVPPFLCGHEGCDQTPNGYLPFFCNGLFSNARRQTRSSKKGWCLEEKGAMLNHLARKNIEGQPPFHLR